MPSLFEENLKPSDFKTFSEFVEATALGKVVEVEKRLIEEGKKPDLVIGADTMVTLDGVMYGKPKNNEEAFNTLKMLVFILYIVLNDRSRKASKYKPRLQNNRNYFSLSGKPHIVYTGVTLKMGPKVVQFTENTKVFIGDLTDDEIMAYVETGEPL